MKKNILMVGALMYTLAAVTTGCNNDELNENAPAGNRFTVTACTPGNGAKTRISYDDNSANKLTLAWEADDAMGVWKADETTMHEFTTAAGGSNADFTSATANFNNGDQLYAVYPEPTEVAGNAVTLDLSKSQNGALNNAYQYMYASASVAENTASFSYKHAVSILKLTLPDDKGDMTSITISATGLNNKATLTMGASPAIAGSQLGNIAANGKFAAGSMAYLYLFPDNLTNIQITIVAADGETYTGTLPDKNLEAGKVYEATVASYNQIAFENENTDGDGSQNRPYTIKTTEQLQLLATRTHGTNNNSWNSKYYKLIADINLAGMNWTPIGGVQYKVFRGFFDGGSKTVSGLNIDATTDNQGLFGVLYTGAIKNLNVSGSVKGLKLVGGVIGNSEGGLIENCSFSGTVQGTEYVGGIVGGTSTTNNYIIACHNSATVTLTGNKSSRPAGGIVGNFTAGAVVGCYNAGNVHNASTDSYSFVGGICGQIASGAINACYNSGAVTFDSKSGYVGLVIGNIGTTTPTWDYLAYLTQSSGVTKYIGYIIAGSTGEGTNMFPTSDLNALNSTTTCDKLNEGIKAFNAANADNKCSWHYAVGTGADTTPVVVAGAPQ